MGDYTNLSIKLDISLDDQDGSLPIPTGLPTACRRCRPCRPSLPTSEITKILGDVAKCLQSGDITSKACQKVLGDPQELLRLIAQCKKQKNDDNPVCQVLDALPEPARRGGPAADAEPPDQPAADAPRPRGGVGAQRPAAFGPRGPTMRQLTRIYDPALVGLLVPGMVMGR